MTGRTTDLASRGRQSLRAVRRLSGGARGLGPWTTAQWAWTRRPGAGVEAGPVENSSFTWVRADDSATTTLFVHNYWSDAYGIEHPEFDALLLDVAGVPVARWSFDLPADATEVVDVRERCLELDVPLPFEGQLLLRVRHEGLAAGRPVQHYADYVRDDGESSGVHGQYGLIDVPLAQGVGSMRVESGGGKRTAVVVQNAYAGPGSPAGMRTSVDVYSADGRHRSTSLEPLAPGASRLCWLDELFEGLDHFLGGRPGHVRVGLGCPSSRLFTYVTLPPDNRMVVNHGTVDRLLQQDPGVPASWSRSWPLLSMLVWCDGDRDTMIGLPNLWGPIRSAYPVVVDVYDRGGTVVARRELTVPEGGFGQLAVGDLLAEAGVALPFVGNAEVRLGRPAGVSEMPSVFDGLVALTSDGELAGEVQVGSDIHNADMPPNCRQADIRRTRIFGRVAVGPARQTWIHLAYPVSDDGSHAPSATLLTLLDTSGEHRLTTEVALEPHGSLLASVDELFPEARSLLGDSGVGVLRVRDTTARLYGYAALQVDGARTVAIDHLTGG